MAQITIDVEFGEPIVGLWCPVCQKPNGYEATLHWNKPDGSSKLLHLLRKCLECGALLPPNEDAPL